MSYLLNSVLIPCHNKSKGATTKADNALANKVTTPVIRSNIKHTVAICIPTSIFQGMMRIPIASRARRIKQKDRTNLNSLTTRKQINKEERIINRYVIINGFVSA